MHILVTGGAGFIGSHLARRLLAEGHHVVVADNLSTGRVENVPAGAELIEVDLGQRAAVDLLRGRSFEAICHLAGQSSGEKSFDDPVQDFDANARSTAILASWAFETGVPALLHASSMSVYGEPTSLPITEDAPTAPASFYGASKLAAEGVLEVAAAEGLRTVSLRMFSVYGPGQDLEELRQGMVSIYLAYILREQVIPVTGSLDRVRDFVHVEDVVTAWRQAIERPVTGKFNLGSGRPTSVRELISRLSLAVGLEAAHPIRECPGSPGDQRAVWADVSRARRELCWGPAISLDDGIPAMVGWARERTGVPAD